jgi:hypothetical protein
VSGGGGGGGGGIYVTVTVDWQLTEPVESVAVQLSDVSPTGNRDPDAGTHTVVTVPVAPDTRGGFKVTETGLPSGDVAAVTRQLIESGAYTASSDGLLCTPSLLYDSTMK